MEEGEGRRNLSGQTSGIKIHSPLITRDSLSLSFSLENGNGSGNALPEFVLVMLRFVGKAKGSVCCIGQGGGGARKRG